MSLPTIVLDLDQTLISSASIKEMAKIDENSDDFKHLKNLTRHEMTDYYIVFERPGLQEFLDYLFENFEVSVWTAASKDYALFIIDKVLLQGNPKRKLKHIFFSFHCDISKHHHKKSKSLKILKQLFKLDYDMKKTFIIDDLDEVYEAQNNNCLIAPPFFYDDKTNDTFLSDVRLILSQLLQQCKDNKSCINLVKRINKKVNKLLRK